MKLRSLASTALFLSLLALGVACGDDTGGDTSDGDDDGNGTDSTTGGGTEESCSSFHECLNGSCQCTTAGKEGTSCPDAVTCEEACKVCTAQCGDGQCGG